jgi:hypothetical protein
LTGNRIVTFGNNSLTFLKTIALVTNAEGLDIKNDTASTIVNNSYSPSLTFSGFGWGGTSANTLSRIRQYLIPISGSPWNQPTLMWDGLNAGGGWVNLMTLRSFGFGGGEPYGGLSVSGININVTRSQIDNGSSSAQLVFVNNNGNGGIKLQGWNQYIEMKASTGISFHNGTNEMGRFFTATGNLLIQTGGTISDGGEKLQVTGTARVTGAMRFENAVEFRSTNGNNKFTIASSSNWNTIINYGSWGSAAIKFLDNQSGGMMIGQNSDSTDGNAMLDLRSNSLGLFLNRGTIATMPNLGTWAGITLSIVGGSGYTNGSYVGVTATGNFSGSVVVNVSVSGGAVTSVSYYGGHVKNQLGETFTIPAASIGGTGSGMSFTITAVNNNSPAFTFYNTSTNLLSYWDGRNYATPIVSKLDRVLIGGSGVANSSSILELASTTQGFLLPKMTTIQRDAISTPVAGLQVYNTTTNTNDVYNGTAWVGLASGNIYTADGTLSGNRVITMGSNTLSFTGNVNMSNNSGSQKLRFENGVYIEDGAAGGRNVQIGNSSGSAPKGQRNVAIGNDPSYATANHQVILGQATSRGGSGIAIGLSASAGSSSLAVNNAYAHDYSVSIATQYGTTTTASGQFVVEANDWYLRSPALTYQNASASTINGTGTSLGVDSSGGNLTIAGGKGTGAGAPGDVIIATPTKTTTGAVVQSLANRVWIKGDNGNVGIGASPDAAFKLDVTGAARVTGAVSALRINTDGLPNLNNFSAAFNVFELRGTTAYGGTAYIYDGGLWRWREGTTTGYFKIGNGLSVSINGIPYNSTGNLNVSVGNAAGGNGSATSMAAIGYEALRNLTTGNNNTSVGESSLYNVTTGTNNTAIGKYAGTSFGSNTNANHQSSIFIGSDNGWASGGTALTNTYIIGNNVRTNLSNVFMLGRLDQTIIVGEGSSVASGAIFQIDSTTKGFRPPTMTTTEKNAISTPAAGLIVYDTTTNKLCCYNGTSWNDLF